MMTDTPSESRYAPSESRYALSFTTGALLAREGALLAHVYVDLRNWEKVRDQAVADNLLQARTHRSGVRLVRETVKRLSALTDREVELMDELTAPERGHLMWVAACRRYDLIGEFAEEVVRERFLLLAPTLQYEDFDGFVRSKALWHDELATIKDSTMQKLRSNVFKMLVEAELLSDSGHVIPAVLSNRLATLLRDRVPSDVRFFPTRSAA
jgi:hypothetical protein